MVTALDTIMLVFFEKEGIAVNLLQFIVRVVVADCTTSMVLVQPRQRLAIGSILDVIVAEFNLIVRKKWTPSTYTQRSVPVWQKIDKFRWSVAEIVALSDTP